MRKAVSMTIEETIIERLRQEAEDQNRTLSNLVELILTEYLKKDG